MNVSNNLHKSDLIQMIECIKITSVIKAVWEFKYLINWSNQDYRAYLGSSSHMCRAKMCSIKNACSMLHVVWSTHVMKPKSFPSFVLLTVMRGPKKKNQCLIRSTFLWVLGVQTQRWSADMLHVVGEECSLTTCMHVREKVKSNERTNKQVEKWGSP